MKKNNLLKITAIFALIFLQSPLLFASGDRILEPGSSSAFELGIIGGVGINMHRGYFVVSDGKFVCCDFDKGSGIGPLAGIIANFNLSDNWWLSTRLKYEARDGEFVTTQNSYPILGKGNKLEIANLEDKIKAELPSLALDIFAQYYITDFGLYAVAGPSFGYLLSGKFTKTESIVSPPQVYFNDGTTSHQVFSGNYDIVNKFLFDLRAGIGIKIPVTEHFKISPEALFSFPVLKLSKDYDWKLYSFHFTVALLYAF